MAYTVKKVAAMSGISVRALHFYDETGLLKPAYVGANGYRFYEEPQLLMLQQILFYRQLGFELKQIQRILRRADFEKVAALRSHREILLRNLVQTRTLIGTVDKTIQHLKGAKQMKSKEMFLGFSVGAGRDRFGKRIEPGGAPVKCKVSAQDTDGALCIFEVVGGWPRHLHHEQDEWIYVLEGQIALEIGNTALRAGTGESVFLPRKVPHVWNPVGTTSSKIINVYQPAGNMEEFFHKLARLKDLPTREQVIKKSYTEQQKIALHRLFDQYGMDLLGPPLIAEQARRSSR